MRYWNSLMQSFTRCFFNIFLGKTQITPVKFILHHLIKSKLRYWNKIYQHITWSMINAFLFFENKFKKMLIKLISTSQYFVKMHSYVNNISSFLIKMCPLFVVIVDVVVVVNVSHFYFFFSRTTWTIQSNIPQSSLRKKLFDFVKMKGNVLLKENVNLYC